LKILNNLNLNKNELQNAVIQPLATAPTTPKKGQVFYDSEDSQLKVYDGSVWQSVGIVVGNLTQSTAAVVTGFTGNDTFHTTAVEDLLLTGYEPVENGYVAAENTLGEALAALDTAVKNAVAGGGELNQNAFSTVKVGSTNITAGSETATLTIDAGSNVTLTPDASGMKLTVAATDTTYAALTVDEAKTGTETALRTVRADYLKSIIEYYTQTEISGAVNALEAHVNAGTVNGTGVIQSVNSSVVSQTVVAGTTNISALTAYKAGWEFRVTTAGTITGIGAVQAGDWVVCIKDYTSAYSASDWTVIQTNIDVASSVTNDTEKVPTSAAVYAYAQQVSAELTAVAALTATGLIRRTADDTWSAGTTVANSELANMNAKTVKGNNASTTGAPSDLTVSQLKTMLNISSAVVSDTSSLAAGGTTLTLVKEGTITNVMLYDASTGEVVDANITISNSGKTATVTLSAAHTNTITAITSYVAA
jgi:hypothetical protein